MAQIDHNPLDCSTSGRISTDKSTDDVEVLPCVVSYKAPQLQSRLSFHSFRGDMV